MSDFQEQVNSLSPGDSRYPQQLLTNLGDTAPEIWAAGPVEVLGQPTTGLFCSSQCPGSVVLKTFDAITRMRDEGRILVGGFHSVMEGECLGILLRGRQPVVWVPARSIVGTRLKPELVPAFKAGRLLIISPFEPRHVRITGALSEQRNRFAAAISDRIFVPYAAPGSRTEALCNELRADGKEIVNITEL